MPQLIERGHIYIAQPPLFKLKKGKSEHYVKDQAELNSMLLTYALEDAELFADPAQPPMTGLGARQRWLVAGWKSPRSSSAHPAATTSACSSSCCTCPRSLPPITISSTG